MLLFALTPAKFATIGLNNKKPFSPQEKLAFAGPYLFVTVVFLLPMSNEKKCPCMSGPFIMLARYGV
jgi:hypothetical protein